MGPGDDFLESHHREAEARLARLFERANLRQRVTMSYDPARIGRAAGNAQGDIADSAADARKRLAGLAGRMPRECWGALVDVCLYGKGLQQIESERGWPRRSAKLVLRIGLDQAAMVLGITSEAVGPDYSGPRAWLPERPPMFPAPEN